MTDSFFIPTEDAADDVLMFPFGKFWRDGKERQFTTEDGQQMVDNFLSNVIGRQPPVNREHKRELGKIGNVTALYMADDGVRGKVEGDLSGFDYISPEVRWIWTHPETGQTYRNVLFGAGATNYPFFLGKMALNSDELSQLWTGSEWEIADAAPSGEQIAEFASRHLDGDYQFTDGRVERIETSNSDGGKAMTEELQTAPEQEPGDVQTEEYAERIAALETQLSEYSEKLEAEQAKSQKLAEAFTASERQRKLIQMTDVAKSFSFGAEVEQFADDLLQVQEADPELYDRMLTYFKAADAAAREGEIFSQRSSAGKESTSGEPFEAKVEQRRLEAFADKPYAEGYTEAFKLVSQENPELARDYARRTRGG